MMILKRFILERNRILVILVVVTLSSYIYSALCLGSGLESMDAPSLEPAAERGVKVTFDFTAPVPVSIIRQDKGYLLYRGRQPY